MAKQPSAEETLANVSAAQLAAQVANWAAQLEFQKERMRLLEIPQFQQASQIQIDQLAFQKAEAAYQHALSEASLTGTYQGQPTLAWLTQQAQMTGVLNGQQTLQGKLNDAQIAQMNHSMVMEDNNYQLERQKFGYQREHDTQLLDYQKQKDLRDYGLSQAQVTGYYGGQNTLARDTLEQQRQQQAEQNQLQKLQLLGSLQGAGNAFKQARVLGAMNQLADAWAGRTAQAASPTVSGAPGQAQISDLTTVYDPATGLPMPYRPQPVPVPAPGGTGTGVISLPPTPYQGPYQGPGVVSRQPGGFVPVDYQAPPTYVYQPAPGGDPNDPQVGISSTGASDAPKSAATYGRQSFSGQPTEATATDPYAYTPTGTWADAAYTFSPPGTQAPIQSYNYQPTPSGQTQVYPPGMAAPYGGTQYSTQEPMPAYQQAGLNPGQVNAKNYANTPKYMQDLGWAEFENRGWDPGLAKDLFAASLPKYGGPAKGTVRQTMGAAA
jgi:hypothetical protein